MFISPVYRLSRCGYTLSASQDSNSLLVVVQYGFCLRRGLALGRTPFAYLLPAPGGRWVKKQNKTHFDISLVQNAVKRQI